VTPYKRDPENTPEVCSLGSPKFNILDQKDYEIHDYEPFENATEATEAYEHYRCTSMESIKDIEASVDLFASKSFDSSLAQTAEFSNSKEGISEGFFRTFDCSEKSAEVVYAESHLAGCIRAVTEQSLRDLRSKPPKDINKAIGMSFMLLFAESENLGSVVSWHAVSTWMAKI
jgi:hypothetical protein